MLVTFIAIYYNQRIRQILLDQMKSGGVWPKNQIKKPDIGSKEKNLLLEEIIKIQERDPDAEKLADMEINEEEFDQLFTKSLFI